MPGKGKPFQKGNNFGSHHSKKLPEDLLGVKTLTPEYFQRTIALLMEKTNEEIISIADNPQAPAREGMIAQVIAQILKSGDPMRFEFLLNRTIGKVKDQQDININLRAMPTQDLLALGQEAMKELESGE